MAVCRQTMNTLVPTAPDLSKKLDELIVGSATRARLIFDSLAESL